MADLNIRINTLFAYTQDLCAAYVAAGASELTVCSSRQAIERERGRAGAYPDDYLESLAVYREIAERLPTYEGFVFHGSAIAVDGLGYVFTAKSGTGKSTHARLWRELLGGRAVMVNDDKPVVRFLHGVPFLFGTPWDGKHRLSCNTAVPLKAVCILERAEENSIREIGKREALPMLIGQAYRPADPLALEKTLSLIDRLQPRLYRLSCNMDGSAAALSYEIMKG